VRAKIEKLPALHEHVDFTPKVTIGINSGEMISGNIGSSSLRRLDYTVIGDVVNTAQRLQSAAGPGQVVISESAYEQVKESFNCRKVGEFVLKNKIKPAVIYEVLD
jgi:class 3 adenylate cyclase